MTGQVLVALAAIFTFYGLVAVLLYDVFRDRKEEY